MQKSFYRNVWFHINGIFCFYVQPNSKFSYFPSILYIPRDAQLSKSGDISYLISYVAGIIPHYMAW